MFRSISFAVSLVLTIFLPVQSLFVSAPVVAQGQSRSQRAVVGKMTTQLRERALQPHSGGGETTRVILNVADNAAADQTRRAMKLVGAKILHQLDALNVLVADVPVDRLAELSARDDVAWISEDLPVRSLSTSTDNTSHITVTTGASKVLPVGNNAEANGGAGNGIGIAVLDSGITPSDAAEFAGYQWQQSGGTLGTGLLSQTYLQSYDRIKKHIDFTGEGRTDDTYGHGTHTAGVAAGTGQSSEDYAAQHAGAPTYGGIATGANFIDVRVLNSQGAGTVSNVIAGINWAIQNKSTYNIRVMNVSLGASVAQSYKTDLLCQAVGLAETDVAAAAKSLSEFSHQELTQAINSARHHDEIITAFLDKLKAIVPYDSCAVTLADAETGDYTVTHAAGEQASLLENRKIAVGEGVTGWVIANSKPFCNTDPKLDLPSALAEPFAAYRTLAVFPLVRDAELFGAVALYSATQVEYNTAQQNLLEEALRIVATALSTKAKAATLLTEPETHALQQSFAVTLSSEALQ